MCGGGGGGSPLEGSGEHDFFRDFKLTILHFLPILKKFML